MRKEIRAWWEGVAEQYEEWAENPPRDLMGYELYTCNAFRKYFGQRGWDSRLCIRGLWIDVYNNPDYPIGLLNNEDRPEKRFHFCHHMAETIREYLETER